MWKAFSFHSSEMIFQFSWQRCNSSTVSEDVLQLHVEMMRLSSVPPHCETVSSGDF
jgi:hypothetical protein